MFKHYGFPSIVQYRNVIKSVKSIADFNREDLPKLVFHGTVKMHGCNAAVVVLPNETKYAQSRNQVLTVDADNHGFARFIEITGRQTLFNKIAKKVTQNLLFVPEAVVIFGEFCGGNIQKGVGLAQLSKRFIIFGIQIIETGQVVETVESDSDEEGNGVVSAGTFLTTFELQNICKDLVDIPSKENQSTTDENLVFCIEDFKTWNLVIDFQNPAEVQNQLIEITNEVEQNCPVAAAFGIIEKNIGEGVVWICNQNISGIKNKPLVFKIKGEKHSISKVKTIAAVDIERVNSIKELASSVTSEARLQQGLEFLKESSLEFHIKSLGQFLMWVGKDVVKEETDTILGNGFEIKEITKAVNEIARKWFMAKCFGGF